MTRRSLMLAGGGLKIAFQAGALEVWLDEAGIEFDHADAVSAACFNLAMWAQGMSGRRIADNWRNLDPVSGVAVDLKELGRLFYAHSLFELDAYRHRVFPAWGIDFEQIRASRRTATFNLYNFSKHELCPVPASTLTEDQLIASASLPVWFPPVGIGGDLFIDAVFHLATNIDEAIRRGADELWVIWTTSQKGEWFDGFVGNFFGVFEATTNHAYKSALRRIEASNRALLAGQKAEFERPIRVRELKAEVPVHYLLDFSRDRTAEAVNRGVRAAREFCDREGIPRKSRTSSAPARPGAQSIQFSEQGRGYLIASATPPVAGEEPAPDSERARVTLVLQTEVDDIDRFLTTPEHEARLTGELSAPALGGPLALQNGCVRWFVDAGDPSRKQVLYRAELHSPERGLLTLIAERELEAHAESFLKQTTRLAVAVFPGRVSLDAWASAQATRDPPPLAEGVVNMALPNVLAELATFRIDAPDLAERARTLRRFFAFYLGRLWDVYARRLLPSAPF